MNCKPGEIAIGVSTGGAPEFNWALGCMVRVIALAPGEDPSDPYWTYEPLSHAAKRAFDRGLEVVCDACLRPIRGEDEDIEQERKTEELAA